MADDTWSNPDVAAFLQDARENMVPKLEASAVSVSLLSEAALMDPKFAIELGYSVLLGKPIVVAVSPGVKVPEKLVLVADHIIEADITTPAGCGSLARRLRDIVDTLGGPLE